MALLGEPAGQSSPGVSVATNGDRVADIRPLGHIQTVQVEVEPSTGVDGVDGEETPPAAENESTQDPPSLSSLDPPSQAQQPPPDPEPPQPSPMNRKDVPAMGRLSPPSLPTVAEGLQEAGRKAAASGKKSKKSKPLSTKDLLPLHKDVGKSNKQLLEPATPEFKPTADWVMCVWCVCVRVKVCTYNYYIATTVEDYLHISYH